MKASQKRSDGDFTNWTIVLAIQRETLIELAIGDPCSYPAGLTPDQARYLAGRLNRLARRIEEAEAAKVSPAAK